MLLCVGKIALNDLSSSLALSFPQGSLHFRPLGVEQLLAFKTFDRPSFFWIPNTTLPQGTITAVLGRAMIAMLDDFLVPAAAFALHSIRHNFARIR